MSACPSCRERLELDENTEGDLLDCPSCGMSLQVVSVSPPEVVVYEEDKWEDEEELEDDEDEEDKRDDEEEELEDDEEWETEEWEDLEEDK